jgi:hypothetical protein
MVTHVCNQVKQELKDINGSCLEQELLVVEFIDPSLTSIYQPPDIVVNGPLKKMIREEYHNHVFELFRNLEETLSLNEGDKYQYLEKILSDLLKMPLIKSIHCGFFQNMWSGSMVRHYKSDI